MLQHLDVGGGRAKGFPYLALLAAQESYVMTVTPPFARKGFTLCTVCAHDAIIVDLFAAQGAGASEDSSQKRGEVDAEAAADIWV